MSDNKNLYQTLKECHRIVYQTFIKPLTRSQPKNQGYMWTAEMIVVLKHELKIKFALWHHFNEDDGESWTPSQELFEKFLEPTFIPVKRSRSSKLVDAYWNLISVDGHFYVHREGIMNTDEDDREEIHDSIKDGSWKQDSDLWMLI